MVEYHHISANDLSRLHQFGPKVLPCVFFGYALHAGENLKRRHHGRRHWGLGKDGRMWNLCKKTQSKGSVNAHEKWKVYIPNRRWNGTTLWRRSTSETIHLNQGSPKPRTRTRKSSRRITRVFFNPLFKTHRCMMVMLEKISGPFLVILSTVITLNPESNCTCREKYHSLFHWATSTWPGLQKHPWMWCWRKYRRLLERWWR